MAQEKIEFEGKSDADLVQELSSMQNELLEMKFDHTVKGLANPLELRNLRRNIARLQTEIRRRVLEVMSPEEWEMRSKIRARRRRQK